MEYETLEDAEKAVSITFLNFMNQFLIHSIYSPTLSDQMQIMELNDEKNWRNGLRVRLLNTCVVINKSINNLVH